MYICEIVFTTRRSRSSDKAQFVLNEEVLIYHK
jgi:hypothetical protein